MITAESKPVLSGSGEWGINEWVQWHKALVKKYYTQTFVVIKNDVPVLVNTSADNLWLTYYAKTGSFSKPRNQLANPLTNDYADAKKYLGMYANLALKTGVLFQKFDPVFTGVKIAADTGRAIASGIETLYKIGKVVLIVGGITVLVVGGAYVYNTINPRTVRIRQ